MKTVLSLTTWALMVLAAGAQQLVGLDRFMPTLEQLGTGWVSNRLIVLVDPLSSPGIVTNASEGSGWLRLAKEAVGRNGLEAYGAIRCFYESNSVVVFLNRYKTLPKVGEEVRFYQRHGIHNNITFRRGTYLVDVEGMGAPIERLKQMAQVLDSNLVKALDNVAPRRPNPNAAQ